MKITEKKTPNFYGGIVLMFPKSVTRSQITSLIGEVIDIRVFDDMAEVTYKELKNFCCWDVNELLTNLFLLCDFNLLLLAQSKFDAKILIDISFHHYHKYPALIFDGANMEIIHKLYADLSIDAY